MSTLSTGTQQDDGGASAESKSSSAPLLQKAEQDYSARLEDASESKPRKRDFWKLGKSKDEDKAKGKAKSPSFPPSLPTAPQIPQMGGLAPASPLRSTDSVAGTASPHRGLPYGSPASPGYRPHSPASSMIFERNVQDDEVLPAQMSPQIPSHVITENHIPAALDASAEAITNEKLDPDTVEIVTHATHQPASVTITGTEHSLASSMHADDGPHSLATSHFRKQEMDSGSNYGSLDSADVRRLSFVSFADVVHAEHEMAGDQRRDSTYLSGGHPSLGAPRSPSPIRSPVSSHTFGTSPPTSISTTATRAMEASPNRGLRHTGSPLPTSSPMVAEYNVETMSQALRRTGSGDLSGARSAPMSAVGDLPSERPF